MKTTILYVAHGECPLDTLVAYVNNGGRTQDAYIFFDSECIEELRKRCKRFYFRPDYISEFFWKYPEKCLEVVQSGNTYQAVRIEAADIPFCEGLCDPIEYIKLISG